MVIISAHKHTLSTAHPTSILHSLQDAGHSDEERGAQGRHVVHQQLDVALASAQDRWAQWVHAASNKPRLNACKQQHCFEQCCPPHRWRPPMRASQPALGYSHIFLFKTFILSPQLLVA